MYAYTIIGTDIEKAIAYLKNGELVAIPTETVYGLAGNGFSAESVAQIFAVKNRPAFDPLILHTDRLEKVLTFVKEIPPALQKLADVFMPGALTLLLPRLPIVPDLVTNGLDRVAVRIPSHVVAQKLLSQLDFPLAAPSANPFGYISPTTAQHVADNLYGKIPYILDGGSCQIGVESTIVGLENGIVTVFRKGGIPKESLQKVVGTSIEVRTHSSSNPLSPGMLSQHYAPRKKVIIGNIADLLEKYSSQKVGILSFQSKFPQIPDDWQYVLSAQGSLIEAAQHLFGALRYLDNQPIDIIITETFPEVELGVAINDRLRRASTQINLL